MTRRTQSRPVAPEPLEDRRLLAAGPEFRVAGFSVQSDVAAADNGRAVYAFGADHTVTAGGDTFRSTEAFVRLSDAAGAPAGAGVRVSEQHRVLDPLLMEPLPMVLGEVDVAADADGDFVVAWTKGIIDGYTGNVDAGPVWFRRFGAAGAPRGPEVRLADESRGVDVAVEPDGDFVIAYGTFGGTFVRRFDAAGAARGGAVEVDDRNLPTWQSTPSLATADDGRFVVAWQTGFQDGGVSRYQVRAQRFGADGRAAGGSFTVRDGVYSEEGPQAAMSRTGAFAVGWSTGYLDGNQPAATLSVQRYDAAGAPRGGLLTSPGADVALALDDAGNLFTSSVRGNPSSDSDVYARRFDAQNQPLDAAFRVNATTAGVQGQPSASVDAAGRFTVLWSSSNTSGDGLLGRRFTFDGITPEPDPNPRPQPRTASIAGSVFNDANGDGRRQRAEAGVSGRRVWLDLDDDNTRDASEPSVLTDSRGVYRFSGLTAGSYRIRQVLPSGWRTSYPASGSHRLTLAAGASVSGKNFATTRNVLVSGTVFHDANRDGMKNGGESGLSGWRVYADADNDGHFDPGEKSVLTDASGDYRFFSLPSGTHRVRVVQQTGWTRTAPASGVYTLTLSAAATATGKTFGQRRT